jgi:hypothetical protein
MKEEKQISASGQQKEVNNLIMVINAINIRSVSGKYH